MPSFGRTAELETGNLKPADLRGHAKGHAHNPGECLRDLCRATLVGEGGWSWAYCANVAIVLLLDHLPETIAQRPGRVWNVLARSLGEQGGQGRTALAWRWALTGSCPSPVSLATPLQRPPDRSELLSEASATAELGAFDGDPGGQVMHAKLVLQWLAGELDAVPLWNAGPDRPNLTDGAPGSRSRVDIEHAYCWSLTACARYPWPGETGTDGAWRRFGWAYGTRQLLAWACGEQPAGPLSGRCTAGGVPTPYEMSFDVRRAMTALIHARNDGQSALVGRMAATMETFLWLAGWNAQPPVDRHGQIAFNECVNRDASEAEKRRTLPSLD